MENKDSNDDKDIISDISEDIIPSILKKIIKLNQHKKDDLPDYLNNSFYKATSIEDYFKRIVYFSKVHINTVIYSFVLIDRIIMNSKLVLSDKNVYLLLLASLYSSAKFLEDKIFGFKVFAKIGGVNISDLAKAEYMFLELLDYNLYIEYDLFIQYYDLIVQ